MMSGKFPRVMRRPDPSTRADGFVAPSRLVANPLAAAVGPVTRAEARDD